MKMIATKLRKAFPQNGKKLKNFTSIFKINFQKPIFNYMAFQTPKNKTELLNLIYPNGLDMPPIIILHEDCGHGWLQVPKSLAKHLKIENDISDCSYVDDEYFFLEEDCDMALFMKAADLHINNLAQTFWNNVPNEYQEYSTIRLLERHKPTNTATIFA